MRRRRTISPKPAKTQHGSTTRPKRNNAPTAALPASSTLADLQEQVDALTRDLVEAQEQQTATAEVLRAISSSPTDAQPVFDMIAKSAARLCNARFCPVFQFDGKLVHFAAVYGYSPEGLAAARRRYPMAPGRGSAAARAILSGNVEEIPDILADSDYTHSALFRSIVAVPMLKDGRPIGAIAIGKAQAGHFPERQIKLLQTFADQAVIAIENVRLFEAEQQRTRELSESLQQQTATADVLKVISRSVFELQPVLDTLVATAARLCNAEMAFIFRRQDEVYRLAANCGFPPAYEAFLKGVALSPSRTTVTGRAALEGHPVHVVDILADPEYDMPETYGLGKSRTMLSVPLLREKVPIGMITVARQRVEPFTDKQVELVSTFADQAVIAIENVRLFDDIQDKSRQLAEASQHKSRFLANMSHELRTPLNAILGYTELILDRVYGDTPDKMRGVLERIERNGRHLLGLINDVLDLSKIEAGQLVLSLSDYSLKSVIQTVFSAVEPLAREKQIALKIDLAQELPQGHGDERRLTQVLLNLVGNAIKFTDVGEVSIKGSSADGSFNVAVRDTGPGISTADQAKLFQEFQQADNSITKKKGGTGLGLAISRRIIEMHGGRIWVESSPGHGSTFSFTFPVTVERQASAT